MKPTAPITLTATLLLLAGCAGAPGEPAPDGDPGSNPGASETADRPSPSVDLGCDELIGQAVVDAAFNPATLPVPLTFEGSGGYYPVSQLGLEQAGALRCEWSDRGEINPSESYLQVSVLGDAADDWATFASAIGLFQPVADAYGDASFHDCRDSSDYASCRVDVLVGDRWLNAVLGGLTSTDAAASVITAAVSALETASDASASWQTTAAAPADCESLAPTATVSELAGEVEPWERQDVPTQPVLYHAGFVAADGLFCSWRNSFSSASALTVDIAVLPGGGWAWEQYWADEASDRVVREAVSGLGDAAFSSCIESGPCYASVLVGDTWLDVTVNDESADDTRPVAVDLARAALTGL